MLEFPEKKVYTPGLHIDFTSKTTSCCLTSKGLHLNVKMPVVEGRAIIFYPTYGAKIYNHRNFYLLETDEQLLGTLVKPITYPMENSIYDIYLDLLELSQHWNLCRIWNYVPYINDEHEELENYKSFCKGRSLAFETFYGKDFSIQLPAATGVGIFENTYVIYFMAVKDNVFNVENPEQVSAFSYPRQYGPRSPSFARGTVIHHQGKRIGYLSGTASIKGHQTLGQGEISQQFYITLDNMRLVFEQMGLGENFPDPDRYHRHFTIYLRHLSDFSLVRQMVAENFVSTDEIIYLQSQLCRADLDIEIEATITEK